MSIGLLLEDEYKGFTVEETQLLELSPTPDHLFDVSETSVLFTHDPDHYKYTRITYTFLDYLRDIGGLLGSLYGFFTVIVFFMNFNGLYHLLTSQLFRVQSLSEHFSGIIGKTTKAKGSAV